ncbi:unnamed protein product [Allacma fusca]|uniref:Uncharacterized protein n=1 Tax=Allacma fusca TaxID=39272 RepID=A0A8J2PCM5_9HEXA|nr:unnamed protein product [Allacma fusca]
MEKLYNNIVNELEGLTPEFLVKFLLSVFKADSRYTEEKLKLKISQDFDKGEFLRHVRSQSSSGLPISDVIYKILFPEDRFKRVPAAYKEKARNQHILQNIRNSVEDGIEVRQVELEGKSQRGVFATKLFSKGDFICEYAGKLMTSAEANKRADRGDNDYTFRFKCSTPIGESWCINAEEETPRLGRLINHGKPNIQAFKILDGEIPRVYFSAIVDISPGQQLFYDYNDRRKDIMQYNKWLNLSQKKAKPSDEASMQAELAGPSSAKQTETSGKIAETSTPFQKRVQPSAKLPSGKSALDRDSYESRLESIFIKCAEDLSPDNNVFTRMNMYADIGKRIYMEDIVQFKSARFDGNIILFAAIFDGHGGSEAAVYCRDNLIENVKLSTEEMSLRGFQNALTKGFAITHDNMLKAQATWKNRPGQSISTAGTTATVLIVFNQSYVVGYVGDSSVYTISLNTELKSRCKKLTRPHTPRVRSEIERIVKAGGKIAFHKNSCRVVWERRGNDGKLLSIPFLNMSRAMGDFWSITNKGVYAVSKRPSIIYGSSQHVIHFVLTSDGCDSLSLPNIAAIVDENKYSNYLSRHIARGALEKCQKLGDQNVDNTSAVVVTINLTKLQNLLSIPSPVSSLHSPDASLEPTFDVRLEELTSNTPDASKAGPSKPRSPKPTPKETKSTNENNPEREVKGKSIDVQMDPTEAEHESEHACRKRLRVGGRFIRNPGGYRAPYSAPKGQYGRVVTRKIPLTLRTRDVPITGTRNETQDQTPDANVVEEEHSDNDSEDSS